MQYKVEIHDTEGNSFRVRLEIPWLERTAKPSNSWFKVLDSGCIKYSSGGCKAISVESFGPTHIRFIVFDFAGLCLFDMFSPSSFVNSSGGGRLHHSWATGANAGKINWALLEDD